MRFKQLGTAAIELALVLPLLLLVLDGVIEFSLLMYDKVLITHAAREAVRAGVVLSIPKITSEEIALVAQSYCANSLLSMGPGQTPIVSVLQSADPAFQTPLQVTVSFTYRSLLLNSVLSALSTSIAMSSTATGLNE